MDDAMDDTAAPGHDNPEQTFVDFAELVSALGDIVPTEGVLNAEGMLSARDFYDWLMHDGQTVLSRAHVLFPDPARLREIARFLDLVATVGDATGAA